MIFKVLPEPMAAVPGHAGSWPSDAGLFICLLHI
ncbi:hypothetical protein CF161_15097 [Pseudomonas sp. CF161]|nr:hypothetical protein CF161_15097 [Pseudomonas sp. CF161]